MSKTPFPSYVPTVPGLDAGMSISGPTALFVEQACESAKPRVIVECGTGNGVSLCALARHAPEGCVIWTIDGHEEFVKKGRDRLEAIEHKAKINFIHAPIRKTDKPEKTWWYDPAPLKQVEGPIDLLFVDGPEGTYDRFPALPYFLERLAPKARIYLDDCNRDRESGVFARWQMLVRAYDIAYAARHIRDVGRGVGELILRG